MVAAKIKRNIEPLKNNGNALPTLTRIYGQIITEKVQQKAIKYILICGISRNALNFGCAL